MAGAHRHHGEPLSTCWCQAACSGTVASIELAVPEEAEYPAFVPVDISRYVGCLLGGAVGDALGAPVEFLSLPEIRQRFGPRGISDFVTAYGRMGAITDDTQMSLFTAEGLLRAYTRASAKGIGGAQVICTFHAYLRWLHTQGRRLPRSESMLRPKTSCSAAG